MATELVTPTTLAELSQALKLDYSADVKVFGLTYDSRDVQPGDLYLAIPGLQHHGIEFLDQAISAGAVAVASDTQGCKIAHQHGLPTILLPNPRIDMAAIAAHMYGHPELKLRVIGVTGTNGKTTVTQMLRHLLSSVGNRVGVIGTLGTFIGDDQIPSARTTPESPDLFKLLAQMVAASVDTVCMEVSSHALELERVAGITFDVAIFTNLTQDHLDFHETMENYFLAKQKLFTNKRAKAAVICTDDQWGNRLLATTDAAQVVSLGTDSDWKVENVETNLSGITSFNLIGPDVNCIVEIPMYGIFNAMNAALCLATCAILGYDPSNLASRFNSLPQVAGRMQVVTNSQRMTALVDYAHTPDAVEKVLANIRTASPKKLVAVLGCGGNRDALKRPIMGAVAAQIADVVVVTDDNPRYEAPDQIRAEILSGITDSTAEIIEIGDRRIAIRTALKLAEPGTVVAVLGKGHEIGQEVSGVVYEFDDAQVIREESANV